MKIQCVLQCWQCGQFCKWEWIVTFKKMSRVICQMLNLVPIFGLSKFLRTLWYFCLVNLLKLMQFSIALGRVPFGIFLQGTELLLSPFRTEFSLGSLSQRSLSMIPAMSSPISAALSWSLRWSVVGDADRCATC